MGTHSNLKARFFVSLFVLFVVAIPILINYLYLFGENNDIPPNTIFEASDLLAYFGALVSAICAGYLGYIAYKLNSRVLALTVADTERSKVSTVILESVTSNDIPWNVPVQGYNNAYDQINNKGFIKCSDIGFHLFNIGPAP